jgi:PIN domain nuclease of toxin-antitoxin system
MVCIRRYKVIGSSKKNHRRRKKRYIFKFSFGLGVKHKNIYRQIKIKKNLNKFIAENIAGYGYIPLPVTISHALAITKLPEIHKDRFARMLITQALAEKMRIITSDDYIDKYNVKTVW